MVDQLPNGCAGFKLDVIFTTPGIAEVNFVEFQSPAVITSFTKTDANTATISGAFQNTVYPAGSTDAWLAKLTIRGNGVGSTPLTITNVAIDDLGGYAVANTTTGSTVNVATASPLAPVVDFTANVTSGPAPLAVKFTDTSLNGPFTTRKWEFGTGTPLTTLSATTPTKVYTTPGNYTVKPDSHQRWWNRCEGQGGLYQRHRGAGGGRPRSPTSPRTGPPASRRSPLRSRTRRPTVRRRGRGTSPMTARPTQRHRTRPSRTPLRARTP